MLTGIQKLLTQSSTELQTGIEQLLTAHFAELANFPCVEGSFKKVYTLPAGQLALACFREKGNQTALQNGLKLLNREKELIHHLQGLGLVTANIHGDPFCINDQYALLMSWIPDATFIDVKDQEAASRKLVALLLDISIPSGEGWVLKKHTVEQDILQKFLLPTFSIETVKKKALFLHQEFARISTILNKNSCLIADLQFLVNANGVYIIDPIDVVKMSSKPTNPNMCEYHSVVDHAQQNNSNFIKLLYDGKRMLQQCLTFCESIESISSLAALEKKLVGYIQSTEIISPRHQTTLSRKLLTRNLPSAAASAMPLVVRKRSIPLEPPVNKGDVLEELDAESPPVIYIAASASPEKKCRSDSKENDPESPTKLLAFQFTATSLRSLNKTARILFIDEPEKIQPEDKIITHERSAKQSVL